MKSIITIQHAQSEQHINGMIGGWADWELTELGVEQANRIGQRLSREIKGGEYVMYASDLLRARRTAEIVAGYLGIEPVFAAALREINLGEANGKPKAWAGENELGPMKTVDDIQYQGAESTRDVWNRLLAFHGEIMGSAQENIIVVSHGGALGIFHAMWLGLEVEMLDKCGMLGGAGGVSFMSENADGRRVLSRLSDRSYIRP